GAFLGGPVGTSVERASAVDAAPDPQRKMQEAVQLVDGAVVEVSRPGGRPTEAAGVGKRIKDQVCAIRGPRLLSGHGRPRVQKRPSSLPIAAHSYPAGFAAIEKNVSRSFVILT